MALATPDVFRARAGGFSEPAPDWPTPASPGALADWLAPLRNDLEAPAIGLAPIVGEVLDLLAALPDVRLARMSGSGATCFALFDSEAAAADGRDEIADARPEWWCRATRLEAGS